MYVLSTGRVGTKLLADLLSFGKSGDRVSHQVCGSRLVNILGNLTMAGSLPVNTAFLIGNSILAEPITSATTDPLRSPLLYAGIKSECIEPDRVAHIVRDPRTFVTSFMNWKSSKLRRNFLHHWVPYWQPSPGLVLEDDERAYNRLSNKFEQFCWVWSYKNLRFYELKNESYYQCFRFEDLLGNDEDDEALKDLIRFFDVSVPDSYRRRCTLRPVNSSTRKHFPPWREWSVAFATTLDRHCGKLMDEFNYGNEAEWRRLLSQES